MDERVFRKTTQSLSFLMQALADVVAESGFETVARLLPWRQEWRPDAEETVTPTRFPDEIAERCVQAYSLAFQLADQAEENATVQGLRAFEDEGRMGEASGSWEQNFELLRSLGLSEDQVAAEMRALHVEPVLTAHPTEAKRQTVLEHQRALYRTLVTLENSMWTKAERGQLEIDVRTMIERLWRTGEIYLKKPSLADERRMVMHYLRHVFPETIRRVEARIVSAWTQAGFAPERLADPDSRPRVTFGNWVGGYEWATATVTHS